MDKLTFILIILSFSFLFTGCAEQGPAEKAGEKIDETVDNGQKTMNNVTEEAAETAEEAGDVMEGPAEQMREKIDDALKSGKDTLDQALEKLEQKIEKVGEALAEDQSGAETDTGSNN